MFSQYSFLLPLVVQYIFLLSFLAVSLYPCVQSQHKLRHKVDDYASFLQFRPHLLELLCWGTVSLAASTNFLTLSSILIDSYTTISTSTRLQYANLLAYIFQFIEHPHLIFHTRNNIRSIFYYD